MDTAAGKCRLRAVRENDLPLSKTDHVKCRSVVGELLHLAVYKRLDLSYSVCALARQTHSPTVRHAALLRRVLRYLVGTRKNGVKCSSSKCGTKSLELAAYVYLD